MIETILMISSKINIILISIVLMLCCPALLLYLVWNLIDYIAKQCGWVYLFAKWYAQYINKEKNDNI